MVATVWRKPFWVWLQLPWICKFEACMIDLSRAYAVEEARTIISAFPHPAQCSLLKSIYHSTSITPFLCLRNGKKKEKHHTKWKKDCSFLRSSRISEKLNIQNIPLKGKKKSTCKNNVYHKRQKLTEDLMKMKGISAWFEENSRFHIFRLYSEDHALHGTNSKISYIWKRMRAA